MSDAKAGSEPSMEEILASIRRIIAEDTEPAADPAAPEPPAPAASAPAPAPAEDVLELTEIVDETPESPPPPQPPDIRTGADPGASLRAAGEMAERSAPESERAAAADRLVSDRTAASSSASFAAIANRVQRRVASDVLLGDGGVTLEEIVKDLLRPLLKDWLDANLPGLVERLVRDEIERLARDAS